MDIAIVPAILTVSGAISLVGGAIVTVQKIIARNEAAKKQAEAKLLHEAKEAVNSVRRDMEGELKLVRQELDNLENSMNKDLGYMKEAYEGDMRALGDKIETLRDDVRNHHSQIITFLTEMLKKRD